MGLYLLDTIPEKYHTDFLISNIPKGHLISPGEKVKLMVFNNNPVVDQIQDSTVKQTKVEPIFLSNKLYGLINDPNFYLKIEYKRFTLTTGKLITKREFRKSYNLKKVEIQIIMK